MNREQKQASIERITTDIKESDAIFVVDYRGMTVSQAASLRIKLREADTRLSVVKNTLTERAADAAEAEELKVFLSGPTAIAFVKGDVALAAKALAEAQKEFEILEFKGGMMSGRSISADDIKALSKLPSRDVLIGQLVGLAASPLSGLVRSLGGLIGGIASQLGQIRDQGLVGGDAPAPAAEAAAEEAPAEEPAAEAEAEETAEQADDESAADAPEEKASADGADEADQSADDNEAGDAE
jgi:large subunit ribosomal protein L10